MGVPHTKMKGMKKVTSERGEWGESFLPLPSIHLLHLCAYLIICAYFNKHLIYFEGIMLKLLYRSKKQEKKQSSQNYHMITCF